MARSSKKSRVDIFSSPRSYVSLLYGAITVVIIFVLVFFGLRMISQRNAGTVGDNGVQTNLLQKMYSVKEGDTLWSIAENQYNDGSKWTAIANANKLTSPNDLETGMKLIIPAQGEVVTPTVVNLTGTVESTLAPSPTVAEKPTNVQTEQKITANSYTVVEGDNLWTIAVRAYGDGYKWTEIAKVNKLVNPDLIHRGNKFIIPR